MLISNLSSALSHEIRNPLSSVKMAVQTVAKSSGLSDRDRKRLDIANREIRTIERMLSLFSEFGRDTPLAPEPASLRGVVDESIALVELELEHRGLRVRVEEPKGLHKVRVDASRVRPVLSQLFLNIAAGLPDEGELTIRLTESPGACSLCVEDATSELNGSAAESIFEPFGGFPARGPGLSLAVLQRLMSLHGGHVSAAPREASGVVFTLSFPI